MSAEITEFTGASRLDTPAERIIERARKAGLAGIVVVGFNEDGSEFFASSYADGAQALWHLERAKHKLMKVVDDLTEGDG